MKIQRRLLIGSCVLLVLFFVLMPRIKGESLAVIPKNNKDLSISNESKSIEMMSRFWREKHITVTDMTVALSEDDSEPDQESDIIEEEESYIEPDEEGYDWKENEDEQEQEDYKDDDYPPDTELDAEYEDEDI